MSANELKDDGNNVFHSLAALGQGKLTLKTISSTPKKVVASSLMAKDKNGRTPLHVAAYCGHLKVLKAFIDACPEASEIKDYDGNSMHDALRRPDAQVLGSPEDQRYFQRIIKTDKIGWEHLDSGHGPMNVWDVSVSGNFLVAAFQPNWGENQPIMLFTMLKGDAKHLDLGSEHVPRYVATSNVHSLVITKDRCFSWGKNVNGVLGLDIDEKIISEPSMLDYRFVEASRSDEMNAFSALGANAVDIKDPLIGVDCCDFHSLCYTTTRIWAWGANRGQMTNKAPINTVVETPLLIFQSSTNIRTVKCCDNAIVILLTSGQIQLLYHNRVNKLLTVKSHVFETVAARGDYMVLQNNAGKLIRYSLRKILDGKDDFSVVWAPRRKKDEIKAFDVGDNGSIILATHSGVFKVEEAREIVELKHLKGITFTHIKTDPQFRKFIGICNIVAGLSFNDITAPIKSRYDRALNYVRWDNGNAIEKSHMGDLTISVGDERLYVHSSVLYARCPSLRALSSDPNISGKSLVAVPGGSAIFYRNDKTQSTLTVEHTSKESIEAFIKSLYFAKESPKPNFTKGMNVGPILHEYHALERLITQDLGLGLWESRLACIGCDIKLDSGHFAHSAILASASPVLAAQLGRWSEGELQSPALSLATVEDVLRYAYTMELPNWDGNISEINLAQRLFELWQVADELLMPNLSRECENRLFEMINFDLVIPFVLMASQPHGPVSSRLFCSLLDIIIRHLPYFIASVSEFEPEMMDTLERLFKSTIGTENPDQKLADSFQFLKNQIQLPVTTPKASKKKKERSNATLQPQLDSPNATTVPPITSKSNLMIQAGSNSFVNKLVKEEEHLDSTTKPALSSKMTETKSKQKNVFDTDGGWIHSRRKPRSVSSHVLEKQDENTSGESFIIGRSSTSSSTSSASSSTNSLGFKSTSIPNQQNPAVSSSPLVGSTSSMHIQSAKSTPFSKPVSSSSSNSFSPLGNLPKLGETLPTLGSQSRTFSNNKGPRPKFNKKDHKNSQQTFDPFVFAETFGGKSNGGTPSTPWKQVPKVVQTSQSVLQSLERAHKSSLPNVNGGKVWGI